MMLYPTKRAYFLSCPPRSSVFLSSPSMHAIDSLGLESSSTFPFNFMTNIFLAFQDSIQI